MAQYINPMNDLSTGLQGIAETVATVIDPNYKFKQAIRNKLATDPDLIRQLSSVEDSAPGTLEAMGFGKQLTSIIRKAPIPEKDLIEKNTRPAVEKASKDPGLAANRATQQVTNMTPGGVQADTFKGNVSQAGSEALQNPNVRAAAGTVATTGARPFQLQSEMAGMEATSAANAFIQQNPNRSIPDIVQGFFNKTIPANVIAGLYNIPQYGEALKSYLGYTMSQMENETRLGIARANNAVGLSDATYRRKYALYGDTALSIGANPDDVIAYMDKPEVRAKADDLAAHPDKIKTPEDQMLAKISTGLNNLHAQQRQQALVKTSVAISDLLGKQKINENKTQNDPAIRQELIGQINSILIERHNISGAPIYTATYGKDPGLSKITHPFGGNERIIFKDAKGRVVDDNAAISPTLIISDKEKTELSKIQSAYLSQPTDSAKVAFKKKLQETQPAAYSKWQTVYP